MSEGILHEHRQVWQQKPVLRAIYYDFYERILSGCREGRSLEIGGGSGNLKEYKQDVISTDIVITPWLDAVADAQNLPFANSSFANIVAVDVLHHIEHPVRFLAEARRVVSPNGRIVLIEPGISPVSRAFYRLFHPEPVDMDADPFLVGVQDAAKDPFDANQAIPTLLFDRYRKRFEASFPDLKIVRFERFSFFAYPLSGGFRSWSLIPARLVLPLLNLERHLSFVLGRWMSFRLFVVLENSKLDDKEN
jgi:SAM-dependent methyltransferase